MIGFHHENESRQGLREIFFEKYLSSISKTLLMSSETVWGTVTGKRKSSDKNSEGNARPAESKKGC